MVFEEDAEAVLIGLKLLEGSREGLELLRQFLGAHDIRADILAWKDKQILHLQRLILSEGVGRIIRNFNGCKEQQKQLLDRVARKRTPHLSELDSRTSAILEADGHRPRRR